MKRAFWSLTLVILWSICAHAQDLTSCGTGYFIDLSIGYTPTGLGLDLCGCSEETKRCELFHIIMRKTKDDETDLLECPNIILTERWWREQRDLVDIFYAETCVELTESATHSDRYEINTAGLVAGDTISFLVCKTNAFDDNIIELSATPGESCSEFACAPRMTCPVEFKLRKNLECLYVLPDFTLGVTLEDTCEVPLKIVTDQYTLMQIPPSGTVVSEDLFVEIKVATDEGEVITTCDVSVILATDVPPAIPQPANLPNIFIGEDLPQIEGLIAIDTIGDGELHEIETTTSVDTYVEDGCAGYEVTYRWSATDACGLTAEFIRTFRVLPETGGPVFASLPADIDTVPVGEPLPLLVDLIAVNPDGSTEGITMISTIDAFEEDNCFGYEVTYRWQAIDTCGMRSEMTTTFYVEPDGAPPAFQFDPDEMEDILRTDTLPPHQTLHATNAAGAADGVQIIESIDDFIVDPCGSYPVTYRWTALDSCGMSSTISRSFNVLPDSLTGFLLSGIEDMNIEVALECNQSAPISIPIDLDQHSDKTITVTVTDKDFIVIDEYLYTGPVDYDFATGESHVIYSLSDLCGNEIRDTINIQAADVSAPIFVCPEQQHIVVSDFGTCTTSAGWSLPQAFDNCDDITLEQKGGPLLGAAIGVGVYEISYEAKDQSNNVSSCSFQLVVSSIDSTTLKCVPLALELDSLCQATITKEAIIGSDLLVCAPNLDVEIVTENDTLRSDTFQLGRFFGQTIKYILCETDLDICCENEIIIADNIAPIITCVDTITLSCLIDLDIYRPDVGVECGDITWRVRDVDFVDVCNDPQINGHLTREFIAVDAAGNSSLPCIQVINIAYANVDSLLSNDKIVFPIDTTISCENYDPDLLSLQIFGEPRIGDVILSTRQDQCGITASFRDELDVDTDCFKIVRRLWTITEELCGYPNREVSKIQRIKVEDRTAPTINSIEDTITIFTSVNDCYGFFDLSEIDLIVEDNCQDASQIKYSIVGNGKQLEAIDTISLPKGVNRIVVMAEDNCLNIGLDTLIVSVEDNVRPVAACLEHTTISIAGGIMKYPIESLDIGSYDNCEIASLQVRRLEGACTKQDTSWGDFVNFCCADAGDTVNLLLRVIDHAGNENFCTGQVVVMDQIAPIITCPPDLVVDCSLPLIISTESDPYGHLFGGLQLEGEQESLPIEDSLLISSNGPLLDGTYRDNCGSPQVIVDTREEINQCGVGFIYRTFTAIDQGGNSSRPCTQTIEIRGGRELDTSSIIWPNPEIIIEECSQDNAINPDQLGRPTITNRPCELLAMSYEDQYFDFSDDQSSTCSKIIRTWTIVDYCSSDGIERVVSRSQVIKVTDGQAPEILNCSDDQEIFVSVVADGCNSVLINLSKEATDNCTASEELSWSLEIDYDNDGSINQVAALDQDSSIVTFEGHLPIGRHSIIWKVTDRCGNQSECVENVNVENAKAPTPIAFGISTSLSNQGIVEVWVSDLLSKVDHPCTEDIITSISKEDRSFEESTGSITFTCLEEGINLVKVYAAIELADGSYAHDHVFVKVDIEDNSDICPDSNNNAQVGNVSGLVYTEDGRLVPNVSLQLYEAFTDEFKNRDTSDNSGSYQLGQIPENSYYYMMPDLDTDPLNGITTLDLVRLQRHIIGLLKLDSPYKIVAADINRDNRVTASDIIDLRRAILRLSSTFDTEDAWRFVNANYNFLDNRYPLDDQLVKELYVTYTHPEVDLLAMKVGDLDGSVVIDKLKAASNRSTLLLQTDDVNFQKGEDLTASLKVEEDLEISGFQFAINYDSEHLEVADVSTLISDLDVHINDNQEGIIYVSGTSTENVSVTSGSELISIDFIARADGKLSDNMDLHSELLNAEIYTDDFLAKNLSLDFINRSDDFSVNQNAPNPFSQTTSIYVENPFDTEIHITISDITARVYLDQKVKMKAGQKTIQIDSKSLGGQGVYYYTINNGIEVVSKKMILMK